MSTNADFYRTRAAEARRDAAASALANVRDRCLRAAEAWDVMADRAIRTDRLRAEQDARKAAQAAEPALVAS